MKIFIVAIWLLACADAFANFMKPEDVLSCQSGSGSTVYLNKGDCGENCVNIPENFICSDYRLTDNMVLDFIRKEKAESCLDENDCIAKEAALICDLGKPIRTENEVYCAVEAYKKDGVKLVVDEAKKAAREAAEEALRADALQKEQEAQAAVDALVNIEDAKGTTIAALRAENNQLRALLRKALRALKK
jgi:hypothetical protein